MQLVVQNSFVWHFTEMLFKCYTLIKKCGILLKQKVWYIIKTYIIFADLYEFCFISVKHM